MFKRIASVIVLIAFLAGLIYIPKLENAYAAVIDDVGDLNLAIDTPVTINDRFPVPNPIPPKSNDKKLYSGKWSIYVDGTLAGYDKVIKHIYTKSNAEQYNFIKYSTVPQWINVLGGNPTFVNTYINQIKLSISGSDRVYIRYLAELNGAHVVGYKVLDEKGGKGEVYVSTTRPPSGNISISPVNPKENEDVRIMLSGTSFFTFWNPDTGPQEVDLKGALGLRDKIVYTVDIDGERVISGKTLYDTTSFTDTITRKFSAGQHTITLYVKDSVDRFTKKDYTFTVSPAPTPPPPPGSIQAKINLISDPPSLKAGTTGDVNATIDATSSVSSGTGPYAARFWLKLNGVNLLGSDGVAVQNLTSLSQAKYTKLITNAKPGDKVWAKVRVWDASINKTSEAETTKIIGQYEDVPTPEPTPPPAPEPVPPVAVINAPSEVIQGDDVYISSGSYDPDGTIVNYSWSISHSSGVTGTFSGESGTVYFDKVGTYTVRLTVTDNDGLTDTAQKTIEVKPAVPKAFFDYTGALKENRKVVLDASGSYTSPKYPMVWDATEWEITPVSSGLTQNDIKIVPSTDMKTRTVLFKKAGDYRVRVRVKNSAGNYSDWYERTLTIVEDLPPVADFFVMATALRDPSNGNMAKIELIDASYSPDGDKIVQRVWRYKYDSNNNGSFDDEQWITLDSGNNTHPVLYTKDVGKYLFELSVKEDFGEETIPEFVSPSYYKTSDTSNKPMKDKICEVINLQPVVDFEILKKKELDLVFIKGQLTGNREDSFDSNINKLIAKLKTENIDVNYSVIKDTAYCGLGDGKNVANMPYNLYGAATVTAKNGKIYIYGMDDYQSIFSNSFRNKNQIPIMEFDPDTRAVKEVAYIPKDVGYTDFVGVATVNGKVYFMSHFSNKLIEFDPITKTYNLLNFNPIEDGNKNFSIAFADKNDIYLFYSSDNSRYGKIKKFDTITKTTSSFMDVYIGSYKSFQFAFMYDNKIFYKHSGDTTLYSINIYTKQVSKYMDLQYATNTFKKFRIVYFNNKLYYLYYDKSAPLYKDHHDYLIEVDLKTRTTRNLGQILNDAVPPDYWTSGSTLFSSLTTSKGEMYTFGGAYLIEDEFRPATQYFSDIRQITVLKYTDNIDTSIKLRNLSYKEGAKRIIIPITDYPFLDLNAWDLVKYILNKDATAGFIGSTDSYDYGQNIVLSTGGKFFYGNNDMNILLDEVADWILSMFQNNGSTNEQYVILGEPVEIKTYYHDPENDPKYQERWMYLHDPNYFENSLGLASFNGKYLDAPVTVFDKVGKYEVDYQARDNPKDDDRFDNYRLWSYKPLSTMYIYVHRRPIAQFAVSMTPSGSNYIVSITDQSYDLDHMSLPNKGIQAWEWKWKEVNETTWHDGKMSGTFPVGKTYLVYLRVQDLEGAWSEPKVQTITTQNINLPPVAQFTVNPIVQVVNKTITITDQSYDPNGDPIAERQWRVQKPDGTWINYGSTVPTNIPFLGVGTYTIELKVKDNPRVGVPLWSEPYTQTVTIIPENNKPVAKFTISPNPVVADEHFTITDQSYDLDGDPIVAREWKVQKPDGTWITINQWKPTFEEMGLGDDGTYKIQLRVLDDPIGRNPNLTPMWSDPYTVTVQVQGKLIVIGSSNKTTYKAGEAMILYARTEGKAYRVEAKMWYPKNEFTSSNVTTLVPDIPLTNPPQDVMTWHTKHTKEEGRDVVVIIPKNMPDGTYKIVFTAYKQLAGGGIKTAVDTITVRVKGTIYDNSKSQIIGPKF